MTGSDPNRLFTASWFANKAKLAGRNVLTFLIMFLPLSVVATWARGSLEWLTLNAGGGVALSAGTLYVLLVLLALTAIVRDDFKGAWGVLSGGLIGFTAGATGVLAYIFSGVSFAMSSLGWVSYAGSSNGPDRLIRDLSESYMWHVFDLIPGIDVNRTLGQDTSRIVLETAMVNGMPDHKGFVLLAFRLIVALVLFRAVVRLFERQTVNEGQTQLHV